MSLTWIFPKTLEQFSSAPLCRDLQSETLKWTTEKKKKKLQCFQFTENRRQRPLDDQQRSYTIWTSNPSHGSFSPFPLVFSFRSLCQLPCHPLPPQCTAVSVFRVFLLFVPLLGILPLTQPLANPPPPFPSSLKSKNLHSEACLNHDVQCWNLYPFPRTLQSLLPALLFISHNMFPSLFIWDD